MSFYILKNLLYTTWIIGSDTNCWSDSRGTPVDHESPHKETWHHTLTQNLKAQVYGSSPHLYGMVLNLFTSTRCGTSPHTCNPTLTRKDMMRLDTCSLQITIKNLTIFSNKFLNYILLLKKRNTKIFSSLL